MKWIGQHIYDLIARFRDDVYLEGISTSEETDVLVIDSNNKVSKRDAGALPSATATLASTVTVTDSTANTDFPVVFHNESNSLLDDTGAFTYNPSTGTLVTPALTTPTLTSANDLAITATGNDITVDTDTFSISSATAGYPIFTLKATGNTVHDASMYFVKDKGAAGADGDQIGTIYFQADNTSQGQVTFAQIDGLVQEADASGEGGLLRLRVANDATLQNGVTMTADRDTAGKVDVDIAAGAASNTTIAGNLTVTSDLTVNGDTITFESANADDPQVIIKNTTNDNQAARLQLRKDRGAAMADNDRIAEIDFIGEDASQNQQQYAKLMIQAVETDHGSETGKMRFQIAEYDGQITDGLVLTGQAADGKIDATIGAGAASTTTVAGNLTVTSDLTVNGDTVTFESGNADDPIVTIKNTSNAANDMASLNFVKERNGGTAAANDNLAEIYFSGKDASGNVQEYGRILSEIDVATHGQESGRLKLGVANHDGGNGYGLTMQGGSVDDEVDVTVGLGAASVTTVSGTLTMGSTATLDNSGILQTAAQTNITSLGTLTALDVDNINLNDKTITITGDTSDTFTIVAGAAGATTLTTTDAGGAAGHFEVAADGNITLDAAGSIVLEPGGGAITSDAASFTITNTSSGRPDLILQNITDDNSAATFTFDKNRYANGVEEAGTADGDILGTIEWTGTNNVPGGSELITYANIVGKIEEVDDTDEAGNLTLQVAASNGSISTMQDALILRGDKATRDANVTLGNQASSTTTVAGNLTVTTNLTAKTRKFEVSSSTDGDYGGDVVYFGGTTSMTTGAIYHYKSDGTWELADADAASTSDGLLGVALGSASDTNGVLLRGMVTIDHDPGAVGDVLYLSTTAGDCSATAPSGNGDIVRIIGYQVSHASNGNIWFNPDGTFVEISA